MKIQNMAVIFIIIILPISLILSVYVKNEIKIINKQTQYDQILNDATYDAVKAFKLNTLNNQSATIGDAMRRDLQATTNTFFNSLTTNLGVSGYGKSTVNQYIPAIVYTLYDGFYIYSPAYNSNTNKYEHIMKPYIYYTMRYYKNNNNNVIVNYTLDNYILVYGMVGGEYISKAGYLETGITINGSEIRKNGIIINDAVAKEYYKAANEFTNWATNSLKDIVKPENSRKIGSNTEIYAEFKNRDVQILNVNTSDNDPENRDSYFNLHRREVIKQVVNDNLSAAIASYNKNSQNLGIVYNFKMPELKETEWERLIENVSMITFMQGLHLGNKYYNGYSLITCDKNKEYINTDAIYYVDEGHSDAYYHRIDCLEMKPGVTYKGYKNTEFEVTIEDYDLRLANERKYNLNKRGEYLACYYCIINSNYNGTLGTTNAEKEKRLQEKYNAIRKN